MTKQLIIDAWHTNKYRICNESETKQYQNESAFQELYSNINNKLSSKVLCIIEGRFAKDNSVSVNGRYYGTFWKKQLAKEEVQFLLRKGLMWMQFGHVDRGIEDKDLEKGLVAGIVTHLQVLDAPATINGIDYEAGDLFGRAIIIDTCGLNSGAGVYALLSVGSDVSISSRGLGEYIIGETHTCEDGSQVPIMNPETYELETFDFTRLPGIQPAFVKTVKDNLVPNDMPNNGLVETIKEEDDKDFTFESFEVSDSSKEQISESLDRLIFNIREKENPMAKVDGAKVQQVLEDANAKIASLTAKLEEAEQERDDAKAKADELEKKLDEKTEKCETEEAGTQPEEPVENAEAVKTEVEKEAPTSNDTDNVDMTELEAFKEIADSPEALKEVITAAESALNQCKEDAEELAKAQDEIKAKDAEIADKDAQIAEAAKTIEAYLNLGTIESLTAMKEAADKIKAESAKANYNKFVKDFSVKKGITLEAVQNIIKSSKSIKDAKMILESLPNKEEDAGLFKPESQVRTNEEKPALSSFAESMISKMETRRTKSYTV